MKVWKEKYDILHHSLIGHAPFIMQYEENCRQPGAQRLCVRYLADKFISQ
jgi:hypothetical protein